MPKEIYRAIYSRFWTGLTGQKMKNAGIATQLLALYLITNSHANWFGLYRLPISYIVEDTSLPENVVRESMKTLVELDFLKYCYVSRQIWIIILVSDQNCRN